MKAQVLTKPGPIDESPLKPVELPIPEPRQDEIRLQVQVCGVCRTDLHIVEGELSLPRLPLIPGHQIVGTVERVGKEVTRFSQGDRAGVGWLYSACGKCPSCKHDKENLCDDARFTGYHVDGGYAQYVAVPESFAYHIPNGFSNEKAAPLLCAGVIGYRSLRLSEVQDDQRLGMYGFGGSAHIVIQVAVYRGCQVYVYTRSEEHQKLARRLGAVWAGRAEDGEPETLDSAIVFAPAGDLVLEALRVLRKGGTIALAGIYMSPIPEMNYDLIYGEKTLRSVANSTRRDAEELLRLAAEIPIHTEVEVFSLDKANKALRLLKGSDISGAAVLEIPQD